MYVFRLYAIKQLQNLLVRVRSLLNDLWMSETINSVIVTPIWE